MTFLRYFLVALLTLSAAAQADDAVVPRTKAELKFSFAPVVKKTAPAVVNIFTKSKVQVRQNFSPFANDPFFQQFFNNGFAGRTREQVVSSLGSGVIIAPDGVIVTSNHVIKDAQEIKIILSDKREFEATVTMRDLQVDLAFLKIKADNLPYLELRDSDTLEVGDLVLAVGNPFGVGQTVTNGIISALARQAVGVSDYSFFIQTDAAINPGNSGGALVDMDGKLIGINTAIYSRTGASNGIGFAIPANMVKSLQKGKTEGGKIVRPWAGVSVQPMTADMAESLKLPVAGVIVRAIVPGSPADAAGLKVGDVIISIGGGVISSEQDLRYRIALSAIGEKTEFKIMRGGNAETLSLTLAAPPATDRAEITLKGKNPFSGTTVANLSPALASELDMQDDSGVVVVSVGASAIAMQPLFEPGDIILEVNGTAVATTKQLEALVSAGKNQWKIAFKRDNVVQTLSVNVN